MPASELSVEIAALRGWSGFGKGKYGYGLWATNPDGRGRNMPCPGGCAGTDRARTVAV